MMVQRTIRLLSGNQYFSGKLHIYVNRNSESYDLTEHYHDFLELSYVCEGIGTHHTGNEYTKVSPGDLFLIPIGLSHVFRPSSSSNNNPLIVYNCIVTMDMLLPLIESFPGGQSLEKLTKISTIFHTKDHSGTAYHIFTSLHREYSIERLGREAALYALLIQLLVLVSRLFEATEQNDSHTVNDNNTVSNKMDNIIDMLHQRYSETFTTRQLAAMYGIGERQFQRLFTKHTSMSVTQYMQGIRVKVACELLLTSNHKISYISEAVGYSHLPFFYEVFNKHLGISPREYRNQHK